MKSWKTPVIIALLIMAATGPLSYKYFSGYSVGQCVYDREEPGIIAKIVEKNMSTYTLQVKAGWYVFTFPVTRKTLEEQSVITECP